MHFSSKTHAVLGKTSNGKYIHVDTRLNWGFEKSDHMDAFRAHANYLMKNNLVAQELRMHKEAMNQHYLAAVKTEGCLI